MRTVMPVDALDIQPRAKGRAPRVVETTFVRELAAADLALLASERGVKPPEVVRLRDRHHALAKCLATGLTDAEASAITGYSLSRISILRGDTSFRQLLAHYREVGNAAMAEFVDRATQVSITALDIIAEKLEDEPESVSLSTALEIATKLGDRTGHAPVTKQVNLNANLDLGGRLASARARLAQVRGQQQALPPPDDEAA